jgi:serine/threonine protein kinase/formylglycine-generating enzyme required for sulfatase activity
MYTRPDNPASSDWVHEETLEGEPPPPSESTEFLTKGGGELAAMEELVGETLDGKYKILSIIGRGGFGAVYKARHQHMNRLCAVKTLLPSAATAPTVLGRFKREWTVASRFRHPHAIELHDVSQLPDGTWYMAMELLEGESVAERIRAQGRMDLPTVLSVVAQVASALAAAHQGGVIHRDLKPGNIFLEQKEGFPVSAKLLDFGIAKILDGGDDTLGRTPTEDEIDDDGGSRAADFKTQMGVFTGTPAYASPEQCAGKTIEAQSDLYSLGIVMHRMLTGDLPFQAPTAHGFIAQHMFVKAKPLRTAYPQLDLPDDLEQLVGKLLRKKPERRYTDASELLADVIAVARNNGVLIKGSLGASGAESMQEEAPPRLRPWKLAMIAVLLIIAATVATWALIPNKDTREAQTRDEAIARAMSDVDEHLGAAELAKATLALNELESAWQGHLDPHKDWLKARHKSIADRRDKTESEAQAALADALATFKQNAVGAERLATLRAAIETIHRRWPEAEATKQAGRELTRLETEAGNREATASSALLTLRSELDTSMAALAFDDAVKRIESFTQGYPGTAAAHTAETELLEAVRQTRDSTDGLPELEAILARAAANPAAEALPGIVQELDRIAEAFSGAVAAQARERADALRPAAQAYEEGVAAEHLAAREEQAVAALAALQKEVATGLASPTPDYDALLARLDPPPPALADSPQATHLGEVRQGIVASAAKGLEQIRNAIDAADGLRAQGRLKEARTQLAPFLVLQHQALAATREGARAALTQIEQIAPLHETMVALPGGQVTLGTKAGAPNQRPAHPVTLAPFWIDRDEVTHAEYSAFMVARGLEAGLKPPATWAGGEPSEAQRSLPITGVTRSEAQAYARWAGKRLPTEAEWEAAARHGHGAVFPWGQDAWNPRQDPSRARIDAKGPVAVTDGTYDNRHPLGIRHLIGNVAEWTASDFEPYPGGTFATFDASKRGQAVARGGSFESTLALQATAAARSPLPPSARHASVGFRCAKSAR